MIIIILKYINFNILYIKIYYTSKFIIHKNKYLCFLSILLINEIHSYFTINYCINFYLI